MLLLMTRLAEASTMRMIYRICDKRDGRTKISQITKRQCFLNFTAVFGVAGMTVVADNCSPESLQWLRGRVTDIHETALGNSQSFLYALDIAVRESDDQLVYLVEDVYLHREGAPQLIREGIERADYVSLYDHPDKYMTPSPNPLVQEGGESTRVILTASTHWKYTNSTTMTFAARARTLKADQPEMTKCCQRPDMPLDFQLFMLLGQKGRRLVSSIPGHATHCDQFPSPFIFDKPFPIPPSTDSTGGP